MAKGEVAQRALPDVSASASRSIHGKVEVRVEVTVDANGNVSNAVFDSPGPSRYFAAQALKAAQNWKFKPPQVNGSPVGSVWKLRFQFRRNGTEVIPTEVRP